MNADERGFLEKRGGRTCVFSPCRSWRYTLWREFPHEYGLIPTGKELPESQMMMEEGIPPFRRCVGPAPLMVIGLNPSTADEVRDDPTIRRCIGFAKAWGFGALCMTNIFAWRDTDPEKMKAQAEPVGAENDRWLVECAQGAGLVLAAWGTHGAHLGRGEAVRALLAPVCKLHCLARTKSGAPGHPLYLAKDLRPVIF